LTDIITPLNKMTRNVHKYIINAIIRIIVQKPTGF
jgi:hypothetical protein